jgi:hypothetical protein
LFLAGISNSSQDDLFTIQAMGALATKKSTHISVLVPMTGYALSSVFAYFVLFDDKRAAGPGNYVEDDKDQAAQGEHDANKTEYAETKEA